jgi:hypothetical protein
LSENELWSAGKELIKLTITVNLVQYRIC